MRIIQITDTHLYADLDQALRGVVTYKSCQAVIEKVQQCQPDIILLTGDLSQDETSQSYQNLLNLVEPLNIPSYWIPGNHDIPDILEQVFINFPIKADKSFSSNNWHSILLNSRLQGKTEGCLSDSSLEWLSRELEQLKTDNCLIALHHHPVLVNSRWMDNYVLTNQDAFLHIIDQYLQVKIVIFGHIHQEFSRQRQKILYLGCPSTCVQFTPNTNELVVDSNGPGFRVLDLNPDGSWHSQVERLTQQH